MDLEDLQAKYETPEALEAFENRAAQCTGHARLVRRIEGESCRLYGFSNGNNPGTIVDDGDDPEEGHHFAVLDERFIVDPWMFEMSLDGKDGIGRAVFDLDAESDAEVVRACYGDRARWVRLQNHEQAADGETLPDIFSSGSRFRP